MYSDATHLQSPYELFDSTNSLHVKEKTFTSEKKFFHNVENVHMKIVIYFIQSIKQKMQQMLVLFSYI